MERLQKILQRSGVASRRKAEALIAEGRVAINGAIVTEPGIKVGGDALISVDGKVLTSENKVYFALHKPTGYVSTTADEHGRRTIIDLVPVRERIFPIGRLDYDTSGLLLLTNDGDFMNRLTHPRFRIEKEYHVKVEGLLRKDASRKLEQGLNLGDFVSLPAKVSDVRYDDKKENTSLKLVIVEGKYHQVRRMFAAIGHPVLKLKRHRFGSISLVGLASGCYRPLKPHEVKQLRNLATYGTSD